MLRDLLLEKGLWVDVAETAVTFSNALVLWKDVKESVLDAFKVNGLLLPLIKRKP